MRRPVGNIIKYGYAVICPSRRAVKVDTHLMICDLCKEDADRILRVESWQVCQWCVSNHVLEHALEVEFDIAKLREAVAKTSAKHNSDVRNEEAAEAKLELAYSAFEDLATAMKELETTRDTSLDSFRQALVARKALDDYSDRERRKTERARQRH